jgi:hypothetical protein
MPNTIFGSHLGFRTPFWFFGKNNLPYVFAIKNTNLMRKTDCKKIANFSSYDEKTKFRPPFLKSPPFFFLVRTQKVIN